MSVSEQKTICKNRRPDVFRKRLQEGFMKVEVNS